jgi:hypothetical protein
MRLPLRRKVGILSGDKEDLAGCVAVDYLK